MRMNLKETNAQVTNRSLFISSAQENNLHEYVCLAGNILKSLVKNLQIRLTEYLNSNSIVTLPKFCTQAIVNIAISSVFSFLKITNIAVKSRID